MCYTATHLNGTRRTCMKKLAPLVITLAVVSLFGFGCAKSPDAQKQSSVTAQTIDRNAILLDAKKQGLIMDTPEIDHMKDPSVLIADEKKQELKSLATYLALDLKTWHVAALADVTGGSSFGLAHSLNKNGHFTLVAVFGGLPALNNGSHYEGWLVKRGDGMHVVNLGVAQTSGEKFVNAYESGTDFSSYDFYVLTVETSVATSEPGEHILEGVIR